MWFQDGGTTRCIRGETGEAKGFDDRGTCQAAEPRFQPEDKGHHEGFYPVIAQYSRMLILTVMWKRNNWGGRHLCLECDH